MDGDDKSAEPAVHVELSETDTESFEDLGPKVALANGGVIQPVVQAMVTNITPASANITSAGYEHIASPHSVVMRRATSTEGAHDSQERKLLPDGFVASEVAHHMWSASKDKAQRWAKIYGNLDNLRPYFDVDPRTICNRILQSFIPVTDLSSPEKIPTELYGPLMITLTLVAVLQMNMKTSNTSLEEATLIETALTTCLGYWLFLGGSILSIAYLCSTYINTIQAFSMAGYGIGSHVIVSFLAELFHYGRGPFLFFWFVIAGASSGRMSSILASRTVGVSQRVLAGCIVTFVHMTFLLYLHFSYHHIVEEIVEVVESIEKSLDIE